ncbi:hypothetical protein RHS01_07040, partial [Rhizoctonia solani]
MRERHQFVPEAETQPDDNCTSNQCGVRRRRAYYISLYTNSLPSCAQPKPITGPITQAKALTSLIGHSTALTPSNSYLTLPPASHHVEYRTHFRIRTSTPYRGRGKRGGFGKSLRARGRGKRFTTPAPFRSREEEEEDEVDEEEWSGTTQVCEEGDEEQCG